MDEQRGGYCPGCGKAHGADSQFCQYCGMRLTASENAKEVVWANNIVEAPRPESNAKMEMRAKIARFVQKNSDYYLPRFEKIWNTNSRMSWNWVAALFSPMWMFYRKMYAIGFVTLGVNFVIRFMNPGISLIISLAEFFFIGFMGNSLYMNHVQKHIDAADTLDEERKERHYAVWGGTGMGIAILILIVYAVVATIITMSLLDKAADLTSLQYGTQIVEHCL